MSTTKQDKVKLDLLDTLMAWGFSAWIACMFAWLMLVTGTGICLVYHLNMFLAYALTVGTLIGSFRYVRDAFIADLKRTNYANHING